MPVRVRPLHALFAVGAALSLVGTLEACDSLACNPSTDGNPPSDYHGGSVHCTAGGDRWYESSPPNGTHLNFYGGSQFKVFHGLGGRPGNVQLWVSFSQEGIDGGNEASPAGNMAEVLDVNDQFILVHNNSCANYWLRVVASDPVVDADAGTDDAGATDGGASGSCTP